MLNFIKMKSLSKKYKNERFMEVALRKKYNYRQTLTLGYHISLQRMGLILDTTLDNDVFTKIVDAFANLFETPEVNDVIKVKLKNYILYYTPMALFKRNGKLISKNVETSLNTIIVKYLEMETGESVETILPYFKTVKPKFTKIFMLHFFNIRVTAIIDKGLNEKIDKLYDDKDEEVSTLTRVDSELFNDIMYHKTHSAVFLLGRKHCYVENLEYNNKVSKLEKIKEKVKTNDYSF